MSGVAVVRVARPVVASGDVASHVFGGGRVVDAQVARLARVIDPRFFGRMRMGPAGQVLAPPPDHPQLGWGELVGRVVACAAACAVRGCLRSAGSGGLCRAHRRGQLRRGVSVEEFAADPARRALARFGGCQVAACPRDRRGGLVAYCEPHQDRWIGEHRADPGLDEARWRLTTSPSVVTGRVSLAGMPPLITAQVLYGLEQRTRAGAHTRLQVLRMVVEDLRRVQADTVDAAAQDRSPRMSREKRTVLGALARHARLAVSDPEAETATDVWELAVFGLRGRLTFTAISQPWLRETAKRWAVDELPRHRGDGAGPVMRGLVASLARLSQSLHACRADHGDHPAVLKRGDIESFLLRLTYLASIGECSTELRVSSQGRCAGPPWRRENGVVLVRDADVSVMPPELVGQYGAGGHRQELSIVAVSTCDVRSLEVSGRHRGGLTDVEGVGPDLCAGSVPASACVVGDRGVRSLRFKAQGSLFHPGVTGWGRADG